MNRELKKRKKRFWVLCMAAVLLLYNILPMTAYAAYYDADDYASFDIGDMLYPGDELKMWNEPVGAFDGPPKITYVDMDGTTVLRVCYVQTEDPEMTSDPNCHIHTVKEYSEFTGNSADAELLKAWEVIHVYRSGSEATKVSLKPLLYTRSDIVYHVDSAAGETYPATNPATYLEGVGVASLESASKTGYNFEGWYSEPAFTTKVTSIPATQTGTVDLYPKFSLATYNINYELDGGTNDATNPTGYTYGTGVMLADASKTGYTFDGWYSDAAFTTRVTGISATDMGNKTLYAKFTLNASTSTPTPTPNPGVTPTPTPNPGVTTTPTPVPAATVTTAPSATAAPMVKDDVPKTGDGMQGILLFGAMLLSGIGLVIVGYRKSFTDEKQG